jgi:8-oxo-dGTP pyrophosphatase MutT (NUDIX family)
VIREELARRLAAGIRRADRSDNATSRLLGDTSPDALPPAPDKVLVPAAVLVPLVLRDDGMTVLLTQRTAHLINHGGQISFPGGRLEDSDANATAGALRETEEEIGLSRDHVEIVGRLDDYVTVTGFRVVPVVGLVQPPFTLTPDPFEVAEAFEVPLAFVLDPANHQRHFRVMPNGHKRYFYAMPFHDRYIWGATAAILVNLYDVLGGSCAF